MFAKLKRKRLTKRAQQRDADAFAELVRPELAKLHQAAFYLARDADEARDLAQATCLKAFEAMGDFRPGAPLKPWLHRILRNLFLDRRKSAAARYEVQALAMLDDDSGAVSILEQSSDTADSPLEVLLRRERQDELTQQIRALPESFQEVLVLCDVQGLSYAEVCEITGLELGTVKSRLSRARVMLRERLVATMEPLSRVTRIKERGTQ